MPRRPRPTPPGAYDSLIDAEREALLQAGRTPTRADLARALADAAALSPREARRAVANFIARRDGIIPATTAADRTRAGWVDDLLDAERLLAARDDRPVTRRTLIRAVHQATAIAPRDARLAVADYLHRRGGQTPRRGGFWRVVLGLIGLIIAAVAFWWLAAGH